MSDSGSGNPVVGESVGESISIEELVSGALPEPTTGNEFDEIPEYVDGSSKSGLNEPGVSDSAPGSPSLSGDTDSAGALFDPSLHYTDPKTSQGVIVKSGANRGKWRIKPGMRPGGHKEVKRESGSVIGRTEGEARQADFEAQASLAAEEQALRNNAIIIVGLITNVPQMVFDPVEWKPTDEETEMMVQAWTDYLRASGNVDLPPWANVAIAMFAYAAPRLKREKTATRLGRIKFWVSEKLSNLKKKRNGRASKNTVTGRNSGDADRSNDPV